VRLGVADALGHFLEVGTPGLEPVMERLSQDLRWQVRERVAQAMGLTRGGQLGSAMKILDRMVKDLIPAVGRAAAASIRRIGLKDPHNMLRILGRAARDAEWLTPDVLKEVLHSLEDVAATDRDTACRVLSRLARDEDPDVSTRAKQLIDRLLGAEMIASP
jgi:hypothetical protein